MQVLEHKSLKAFNTFGIDVNARYFVSVQSISELKEGYITALLVSLDEQELINTNINIILIMVFIILSFKL